MTSRVLLTEPEAAEALHLCTRTLRKARQQGKLAYILIGRSVRYTMDDLNRFIEASRQDAGVCKRTTPRRTIANRKSGNIVPFSARH